MTANLFLIHYSHSQRLFGDLSIIYLLFHGTLEGEKGVSVHICVQYVAVNGSVYSV